MFDFERSSDSLRFGRYRGFDGTHQIAGRVEHPCRIQTHFDERLARMDHDGIVAAVATRQGTSRASRRDARKVRRAGVVQLVQTTAEHAGARVQLYPRMRCPEARAHDAVVGRGVPERGARPT